MAFTRKALKDMGLPEDQVDKVMTLHGTSMSDYLPKSQIDEEIKKATGGADIKALQDKAIRADELEKQLAAKDTDYAVNDYLSGKGVKKGAAMKMVRSQLDMSKIKLDGGKLSGIDEQIDALSKDESVAVLFSKKPDDKPPAGPAFGAAPKGSAPSGEQGPNFADFMNFIPKKK